MTRALAIAALLAAACHGGDRDVPTQSAPMATVVDAPPLPAIDLPDAAIIRAKIGKTEVVPIDPSPELQAAADDYAKAKAELGAARAAEPPAAAAASLPDLHATCAEARRDLKLTGGLPPKRPADFPPTPQGVELCGWTRAERGATELVYETNADDRQVQRYFSDAMLARGHTVEPWDPEASPYGFDFGNGRWSGSFDTHRGHVTVTLNAP